MSRGRKSRPSYHQGYARSAGESANPGRWKGLVGAWEPSFGPIRKLGTIRDVSGHANHGTLVADAVTVIGRDGYALTLDGTGDYVAVGTGVWDSTGPVTMVLWTNSGLSHANGTGGFGNNSDNDRLQAHIPFSDGILYWDYGNVTTGRLSVSYSSYEDKWTHVALTSQGQSGAGMEIFLDGVSVASKGSSDGPSGAIGFEIGRFLTNDSLGEIGSTSLYNRVITANEVQQNFQDSVAAFRRKTILGIGTTAAPAGGTGLSNPLHGPLYGPLGGPIA